MELKELVTWLTDFTTPTVLGVTDTAATAARYRARKAARIARKRNLAQNANHKAAIARQSPPADTVLALTGKGGGTVKPHH